MKISIITVCYNSEKTIERTIKSVLAQKDVDLEYIIKDGGSKDKTVDIIKQYAESPASRIQIKYVSSPDKGIYDAMNTGIQMASGDAIGILNSDDYYASFDVLSDVVSAFERSDVDSVYGNLLYVKKQKPYRYWKSGNPRSFKFGWMPPHPAFFVRKSVYEKYGLFRLDCGINADYELLLRFLEVNKISSVWINKILTYMETGGTSNNGLSSRIAGLNNDRIAWEKNSIKPNKFTILLKKLRKIPQFLRAKMIKIKDGYCWGGVKCSKNVETTIATSFKEAA